MDILFEEMRRRIKQHSELSCVIVSDSMSPVIKTGETIKIKPIERPLSLFDLIVFLQDNRFVCHMVLNNKSVFSKDSYLTASYKYANFDFPVGYDQALGVVVSHKLSWLQKFIFLCRYKIKW